MDVNNNDEDDLEFREEDAYGRVLSIQSHVVHGYVGNRCAVLPLQLLGFEVDQINSVQYSNHTGYKGGFKGQKLNGTDLEDLIDGLGNNDILKDYTHLLTGYIGSVSFLRSILATLRKVREHSPNLVYFCDPVLGDKGKLYVPEELVEVYKTEILPQVSVLLPNQFELELLSDVKLNAVEDIEKAFEIIHAKGVNTVILTSCDVRVEAQKQVDCDTLVLFASRKTGQSGRKLYQALFPRIDGHFTGTGDLLAALLLAWTTRLGEDLFPAALERALSTMQCVLMRTKHAIDKGKNPNGEILIVQSRREIADPEQYENAESNGSGIPKRVLARRYSTMPPIQVNEYT